MKCAFAMQFSFMLKSEFVCCHVLCCSPVDGSGAPKSVASSQHQTTQPVNVNSDKQLSDEFAEKCNEYICYIFLTN